MPLVQISPASQGGSRPEAYVSHLFQVSRCGAGMFAVFADGNSSREEREKALRTAVTNHGRWVSAQSGGGSPVYAPVGLLLGRAARLWAGNPFVSRGRACRRSLFPLWRVEAEGSELGACRSAGCNSALVAG